MSPDRVIIYTDGGSRGNPGPSAAAFVLTDSRANVIKGSAKYLGKATNNEAEYSAFKYSLKAAAELKIEDILVYSDSELLVRQINGQYRVKSAKIRPLYSQAMELLTRFKSWRVVHITRDKNELADALVNDALDRQGDVEMQTSYKSSQNRPIRLGVLLSGGGTTLLNILHNIKTGALNAEIAVVISSLSKVKGVERSRNAGLETLIVRKADYTDIESFSLKLAEQLKRYNVDLVIQAGWLCLWKIPPEYENKVMNIHPALLPNFGGQGMWGHHVHEAVLKAGCKITGCTQQTKTHHQQTGDSATTKSNF